MTTITRQLKNGMRLKVERNPGARMGLPVLSTETWTREGWITGCAESIQRLYNLGVVTDVRNYSFSGETYEAFVCERVTTEERKAELTREADEYRAEQDRIAEQERSAWEDIRNSAHYATRTFNAYNTYWVNTTTVNSNAYYWR